MSSSEFLEGVDLLSAIVADVNADAEVAAEQAIIGKPGTVPSFEGMLAVLKEDHRRDGFWDDSGIYGA